MMRLQYAKNSASEIVLRHTNGVLFIQDVTLEVAPSQKGQDVKIITVLYRVNKELPLAILRHRGIAITLVKEAAKNVINRFSDCCIARCSKSVLVQGNHIAAYEIKDRALDILQNYRIIISDALMEQTYYASRPFSIKHTTSLDFCAQNSKFRALTQPVPGGAYSLHRPFQIGIRRYPSKQKSTILLFELVYKLSCMAQQKVYEFSSSGIGLHRHDEEMYATEVIQWDFHLPHYLPTAYPYYIRVINSKNKALLYTSRDFYLARDDVRVVTLGAPSSDQISPSTDVKADAAYEEAPRNLHVPTSAKEEVPRIPKLTLPEIERMGSLIHEDMSHSSLSLPCPHFGRDEPQSDNPAALQDIHPVEEYIGDVSGRSITSHHSDIVHPLRDSLYKELVPVSPVLVRENASIPTTSTVAEAGPNLGNRNVGRRKPIDSTSNGRKFPITSHTPEPIGSDQTLGAPRPALNTLLSANGMLREEIDAMLLGDSQTESVQHAKSVQSSNEDVFTPGRSYSFLNEEIRRLDYPLRLGRPLTGSPDREPSRISNHSPDQFDHDSRDKTRSTEDSLRTVPLMEASILASISRRASLIYPDVSAERLSQPGPSTLLPSDLQTHSSEFCLSPRNTRPPPFPSRPAPPRPAPSRPAPSPPPLSPSDWPLSMRLPVTTAINPVSAANTAFSKGLINSVRPLRSIYSIQSSDAKSSSSESRLASSAELANQLGIPQKSMKRQSAVSSHCRAFSEPILVDLQPSQLKVNGPVLGSRTTARADAFVKQLQKESIPFASAKTNWYAKGDEIIFQTSISQDEFEKSFSYRDRHDSGLPEEEGNRPSSVNWGNMSHTPPEPNNSFRLERSILDEKSKQLKRTDSEESAKWVTRMRSLVSNKNQTGAADLARNF